MTILVDTNVWLRSSQPDHRQHSEASTATKSLMSGGHELAIAPQVLYEFWAVATRPLTANGLGFSASRADSEMSRIRRIGSLYDDDSNILPMWHGVVTKYQVFGKKAHDARLVAAMLRHHVTHLLTFNGQDFARYGEITVLAPAAAANFPPATE
jgi:predicted nucleic acid-binding protein